MRRLLIGIVLTGLTVLTQTGCAGRAELWPNSDPTLRKNSTQFAADAAKRFPYKAEAPHAGQALANAEVGYFLDRLDITNLSNTEWTDVEVWINQSYVVYLPRLEPKIIKSVPFQAIYNDQGQYYPTHDGGFFSQQPKIINKVELYRDGKLYDVPVRAAE